MIGRIIVASITTFAAVHVHAEVVSYEGSIFPDRTGWTRDFFCTPERWTEEGWFHQAVEPGECFDPPSGDRDSYSRPISEFIEAPGFFVEWRLEVDGDSSEILWGGPAILSAWSQGPVLYWFAIARDQIKFVKDAFAVVFFVDMAPGVPHCIRLEQIGVEEFRWFLDGQLVFEDVPAAAYPSFNPHISWRAKSAFLTSEVSWDFVRYGDIPAEGSFDYDSDGDVDSTDHYFLTDCLGKDGPGIYGGPGAACPEGDDTCAKIGPLTTAGPGCTWADSDGDGDVDLRDIAAFQNAYTGDGE